MNIEPLILASQSPRRRQLLEWADVPFKVIVSHTDETFPEHLDPAAAAIYIAKQKALAVQVKTSYNEIILAADTIVLLQNEILGKPRDEDEAISFLEKLSGNTHQVITGVCLLKGDKELNFSETTKVRFHQLTRQQIEYYVYTYKPMDKAGAYAIQEWIGVTGIAGIEGDFYNVMGLPVSRVVQALENF
ncbi:MAG: Maf family protein [Ferruginibacter sp.]